MTDVRVVVSDERPLARAALSAALAADGRVEVRAMVGGKVDTVRACRAGVDVVVLGVGRRVGAAVSTCVAVKQMAEAPNVVVLGDEADEALLLSAVLAGADGFATTATSASVLCSVICEVGAGDVVIPPRMLRSLLRDLTGRRQEHAEVLRRFMTLTNRERQVLELLADGCDRDTVADILVISPQTARTHIQNVLQKLGVHSRLKAAAVAVEFGLVEAMPSTVLLDMVVER